MNALTPYHDDLVLDLSTIAVTTGIAVRFARRRALPGTDRHDAASATYAALAAVPGLVDALRRSDAAAPPVLADVEAARDFSETCLTYLQRDDHVPALDPSALAEAIEARDRLRVLLTALGRAARLPREAAGPTVSRGHAQRFLRKDGAGGGRIEGTGYPDSVAWMGA